MGEGGGGGLYPGGFINGCVFWFTGKWPFTREAYKRQFTVRHRDRGGQFPLLCLRFMRDNAEFM